MRRYYSLFLIAAFLFACTSPKVITTQAIQGPGLVIEGKLYASAFMQKAAEYHALCLQAFNIAHWRLDEILRTSTNSKLKAIITDLDETILDNSADEVHRDLQGKQFDPVEWNKWTAMAAADTIPGGYSFLKYASSKGVEIFYITNRDEKDREGTLKNLLKFNFPNADNAHLLVRQNTSSKEARRQQVMAEHDVVLLLGDNLSDFSSLYDNKRPMEERLKATNDQSAQFGSRFIVLPNPIYGDWESAMYQYKSLTPVQKDSAVRSLLKGY